MTLFLGYDRTSSICWLDKTSLDIRLSGRAKQKGRHQCNPPPLARPFYLGPVCYRLLVTHARAAYDDVMTDLSAWIFYIFFSLFCKNKWSVTNFAKTKHLPPWSTAVGVLPPRITVVGVVAHWQGHIASWAMVSGAYRRAARR
jgi:hypothetical protein